MTALGTIRSVDYTAIYVRDMAKMRAFYRDVMGFPVERELGEAWIEHRVGSNILALADRIVVIYRGQITARLEASTASRDTLGLLIAGGSASTPPALPSRTGAG